jgi:hypothetical protein
VEFESCSRHWAQFSARSVAESGKALASQFLRATHGRSNEPRVGASLEATEKTFILWQEAYRSSAPLLLIFAARAVTDNGHHAPECRADF